MSSLAPLRPPRAWFTQPEADSPTPLTFTADGQVYGHLALYETCHSGFQGGAFSECVQAPRSGSNYSMFHLGQLETDDGKVAVGKLTYGTGHAPLTAGLQAASAHYDNTGIRGCFRTSHGWTTRNLARRGRPIRPHPRRPPRHAGQPPVRGLARTEPPARARRRPQRRRARLPGPTSQLALSRARGSAP